MTSKNEKFQNYQKFINATIPSKTINQNILDSNARDLRVISHFRENKRQLPIVAQDYSYTMDIMFVTSVLTENTMSKNRWKRTISNKRIRRRDSKENNNYTPAYIGALVLVETTSRKIWAYKLHSKDPREVLYIFKQFYKDVNGKVARLLSDAGQEYSYIKKWNDKYNLFHYWQVFASQNMHTTLSRVDCAIKTLKKLISDYYRDYDNTNWEDVLQYLVNLYNHTVHSSLFLKTPKFHFKIKYTPEQVWKNPELRRRIKIKDYLRGYKNYEYINENFKPGTVVYYRLLYNSMRRKSNTGFVSQLPAIIVGKVGNTFRIKLKNSVNDPVDKFNGPIINVPAHDIVPVEKVVKKSNSKYKLKENFDKIRNYYAQELEKNGIELEKIDNEIKFGEQKYAKNKKKNKKLSRLDFGLDVATDDHSLPLYVPGDDEPAAKRRKGEVRVKKYLLQSEPTSSLGNKLLAPLSSEKLREIRNELNPFANHPTGYQRNITNRKLKQNQAQDEENDVDMDDVSGVPPPPIDINDYSMDDIPTLSYNSDGEAVIDGMMSINDYLSKYPVIPLKSPQPIVQTRRGRPKKAEKDKEKDKTYYGLKKGIQPSQMKLRKRNKKINYNEMSDNEI